jgi:hypothetical protein
MTTTTVRPTYSSGLPRSAMTLTSWIWSEVDAVIADTELFPNLAVSSVLDDDDMHYLDLGLAGLNLDSIFLFRKHVSCNGSQLVCRYCGGHSSNAIVATGHLPIATVGCGPLLQ